MIKQMLFVFLVALILFLAYPKRTGWTAPWPVDTFPVFQAKEKEVRTQVVGTGKTKSEAQVNADRNARQVSGGSYVVLERNVNGSGTNWVCTLLIRYKSK